MPDLIEDPSLIIGDETHELMKLVWPSYLIERSDIQDPSFVFKLPATELKRRSPTVGLREESSGRLVAAASALLVNVEPDAKKLPNDGWSFAMKNAMTTDAPNAVCLLSINVHPQFQNLGLAEHLIGWMKEMTSELGFAQLIGPVRPILKGKFPSAEDQVVDPWLRLHVRMGAEILNVCHQSVIVRATPEWWRRQTGLELTTSGSYEIPRGLAPLELDLESGTGLYVEPNIWVRYRV